mgnify:CR=1 FL=1
MGPVKAYLKHHFRHFNEAAMIDAADAYASLIDNGGKMMMTLAGAMSTAELGLSLAEMIRRDKVHAITCTGANLEEDSAEGYRRALAKARAMPDGEIRDRQAGTQALFAQVGPAGWKDLIHARMHERNS